MTDDLVRELSTVLAERAGYPATNVRDALAEHERRLRVRARTVRARVVAATAMAVALIGAGAVLVVSKPSGRQEAQPAAVLPSQLPSTGAPAPDPTFKLADFTARGKQWTAYVMITDPGPRDEKQGERCVQIVGVPAGQPATSTERYPDAAGCQRIKVWPNDPLIGQHAVLPVSDTTTGPLPNLTVWVTVPAVSDISVVRSGGDTIHASLLGTAENVKLFVTSKEIKFAKQYTFRDNQGTVLRQDDM